MDGPNSGLMDVEALRIRVRMEMLSLEAIVKSLFCFVAAMCFCVDITLLLFCVVCHKSARSISDAHNTSFAPPSSQRDRNIKTTSAITC